tara:strand:+ start:480 stop:986 length:507 start_codon:yes stop_codon:yes gene_type:complete
MWLIAKVKNKERDLFKKELVKNTNGQAFFFEPKIRTYKKKNKTLSRYLLDEYIFCESDLFKNKFEVNKFKFTLGLDYFLISSLTFQNQVKNFILKCKKYQDSDGFITNKFFIELEKKNFKFVSGPFLNFLFKIIYYKKNKFLIEVNNKKIFFNNNESNYNFVPTLSQG